MRFGFFFFFKFSAYFGDLISAYEKNRNIPKTCEMEIVSFDGTAREIDFSCPARGAVAGEFRQGQIRFSQTPFKTFFRRAMKFSEILFFYLGRKQVCDIRRIFRMVVYLHNSKKSAEFLLFEIFGRKNINGSKRREFRLGTDEKVGEFCVG